MKGGGGQNSYLLVNNCREPPDSIKHLPKNKTNPHRTTQQTIYSKIISIKSKKTLAILIVRDYIINNNGEHNAPRNMGSCIMQGLSHGSTDLITREQLATIPLPPSLGTRHRPVAHSEFVGVLTEQLAGIGYEPAREVFSVSKDHTRLFGVLDLAPVNGVWQDAGQDVGFSMGIRHGNDRSLSIRIVAGARVFVCDNLIISGANHLLNCKHTTRLNLFEAVSVGLENYLGQREQFQLDMDRLRNTALTDTGAKVLLCETFGKGVVPATFFKDVYNTYFKAPELEDEHRMPDVEPRSHWGMHNAFTRTFSDRAQTLSSLYNHTQSIGRHFSL